MVAGHGIVGDLFDPDRSRTVVMSYDYTVLAGTRAPWATSRRIGSSSWPSAPACPWCSSRKRRQPPRDTDGIEVAGLDCLAFWTFGQLSGQVPLIGITSGRCFARSAALLGTCDVVIATENSNIGMGGPAMIEGGGLGVSPEAVGPLSVRRKNGVVDLVARARARPSPWPSNTSAISRGREGLDLRRPAHPAPSHSRKPAARFDVRRSSTPSRMRAPYSSCAGNSEWA